MLIQILNHCGTLQLRDLRHPGLWSLTILWIALVSGCGTSVKKYYPATDTARTALETGLEKWQAGDAHGTIQGDKIGINFIDQRWQSGKKLLSYEILNEEKSDGPKTFLVKMQVSGEKEPGEVKYMILGIDPLWIYRDQDYAKLTGTGS